MSVFTGAWTALCEDVTALSEADMMRPSGCAGWLVQDLVFHLLINAQDVLAGLARATDAPATTDAAGLWRVEGDTGEPPAPGTDPHARFVRRGSMAYGTPAGLLRHFSDLATAAGRAAAAAPAAGRVESRGQVATVEDFLAWYAVETTLHHIDLHADAEPPAAAIALARSTMDALLPVPTPSTLDDRTATLAASGRITVSGVEPLRLG